MMRMQVFRRRFLIAASLFLVMLTFPVFVNPTSVIGDGDSPDCSGKNGIYIKGNEDFNGEYDFAGEGTADDPFIIEGLQIRVKGYGIRIRDTSAHFIIRDCEFEGESRGWGSTAIYLSNVENGVIENSDFFMMNRGIEIHRSENIIVQDTEINSVRIGIRIKHSKMIQLSNNEITNTRWCAIYVAFSYDCTITDNTIANNEGMGVLLYDSSSCTLFGNYFEANERGNAKDIIGELTATDTNLWDDGVSLGNEWDDYEGVGVYPIPGDKNSVDRYPIGSVSDTTAPVWSVAFEDQVIECGSLFKMVLKATDANGISYFWISDMDHFNVDNVDTPGTVTSNEPLALGEYPLEVRAYDPSNNYCSATFTVIVRDTVCPEILGPADVTYKEGETGNTIEWTIFDSNPSSCKIYRDDVLIREIDWDEPSFIILVSVDGLIADTYLYRLDAFDLGGNSVSDAVTVVVEPEKTSTTITTTGPIPKPNTAIDPPSDDSMAAPVVEPVLIASGIAIPTVIGIVLLYIFGRKREGAC